MSSIAPTPEEMNVYQNAEARFEVAAQKLGLEQGLYRYLKYPDKEITLYIPVGMDNGHSGSVHRISRVAFHGARAGQGRNSLCARCESRRSARSGHLDDVEVRGGQHSLRWRERRHHLRSAEDVARRTRTSHAPLHRRAGELAGSGTRCSRAGRGHQRTDHGLGHGHLRNARGPGHDRGGHRQAHRIRWLRWPPRSYRPRRHDLLRQSARQAGHQARRLPRGHSGIRQRGLHGRDADAECWLQDRRACRHRRRPVQREWHSTCRRSSTGCIRRKSRCRIFRVAARR